MYLSNTSGCNTQLQPVGVTTAHLHERIRSVLQLWKADTLELNIQVTFIHQFTDSGLLVTLIMKSSQVNLWHWTLTFQSPRSHFQSHRDFASHVWSCTSLRCCRSEPPVWRSSPGVCNYWTFWFIWCRDTHFWLTGFQLVWKQGKYLTRRAEFKVQRGAALLSQTFNWWIFCCHVKRNLYRHKTKKIQNHNKTSRFKKGYNHLLCLYHNVTT